MRTIVLIAAMVLASASAQASDSRSLTTGPDTSVATPAPGVQQSSIDSQEIRPAVDQHAYNDTPSTTGTSTTTGAAGAADTGKMADTGKTDAPRYTVRPSATQTTSADSGTTTQSSSSDEPPRSSYERRARTEHSSYRQGRWTADRVIGELHRHGIYW